MRYYHHYHNLHLLFHISISINIISTYQNIIITIIIFFTSSSYHHHHFHIIIIIFTSSIIIILFLTLFCESTSTPNSSRARTIFSSPFSLAQMRAVDPFYDDDDNDCYDDAKFYYVI